MRRIQKIAQYTCINSVVYYSEIFCRLTAFMFKTDFSIVLLSFSSLFFNYNYAFGDQT